MNIDELEYYLNNFSDTIFDTITVEKYDEKVTVTITDSTSYDDVMLIILETINYIRQHFNEWYVDSIEGTINPTMIMIKKKGAEQ